MYALEGSDCAIVPMKLTNKEGKTSAEPAEGRARTKENDVQSHTHPGFGARRDRYLTTAVCSKYQSRLAHKPSAPHADKCEVTLGIATPKYIVEHAQAYAPEELKSLPPLDHNGVDVGLCEKASIILFLSKGKWLRLQGAD